MASHVVRARYAACVARRTPTPRGRARGSIETLPSGALRVRVYAGTDPVTGRRHYVTELVKPGPKAERDAETVRDRLLSEVAEKRSPRSSSTIDELLERHLEQFDGSPNTLALYRGHVRRHISPLLGRLKVGQLDAETLDSFYAELRLLPRPLPGARVGRPPHQPAARLRSPLRPASVQAADRDDGAPHPFHPVRRVQARRPVALGWCEPARTGRAAPGPETESAATERSGGRPHPERGVARSGLGHPPVDRHDDRCPPR